MLKQKLNYLSPTLYITGCNLKNALCNNNALTILKKKLYYFGSTLLSICRRPHKILCKSNIFEIMLRKELYHRSAVFLVFECILDEIIRNLNTWTSICEQKP